MSIAEDSSNLSERDQKRTRKKLERGARSLTFEDFHNSEEYYDEHCKDDTLSLCERSKSACDGIENGSDSYEEDDKEFNSLKECFVHLLPAQKRQPLPKLTILQTKVPKKTSTRLQMEKMLVEVTLRSDHKLKALAAQAQDLYEQTEVLRDENKAIKRLQRQQMNEMDELTMFVRTAHNTVVDIRKAVRYTEDDCLQMSDSLRKKNKKILRLRDECGRYEMLLARDRRLPSKEELEKRIEKAEERLVEKDKKIEDLDEQMKEAEKKAAQIHNKQSKRQAELKMQIEEMSKECDELKKRIKNAERRIHNTNVYSRKQQPTLGAAPKLAAITWYPPNKEENSEHKVKKWLQNNVKKIDK